MRIGTGKVVVNWAMSLDGFIAGPGDDVSWIGELAPSAVAAEVAKATGAMLVGRRTWDVGERIKAEEPVSSDYPFIGPTFVLTHRPLDRSVPGVTVLSGDITEAVATALAAAGGKDLEILGADVAAQALRNGLVDEILVYPPAGRARRRRSVLGLGQRQGRPRTDQQRAGGRRHRPPFPGSQVARGG